MKNYIIYSRLKIGTRPHNFYLNETINFCNTIHLDYPFVLLIERGKGLLIYQQLFCLFMQCLTLVGYLKLFSKDLVSFGSILAWG